MQQLPLESFEQPSVHGDEVGASGETMQPSRENHRVSDAVKGRPSCSSLEESDEIEHVNG